MAITPGLVRVAAVLAQNRQRAQYGEWRRETVISGMRRRSRGDPHRAGSAGRDGTPSKRTFAPGTTWCDRVQPPLTSRTYSDGLPTWRKVSVRGSAFSTMPAIVR